MMFTNLPLLLSSDRNELSSYMWTHVYIGIHEMYCHNMYMKSVVSVFCGLVLFVYLYGDVPLFACLCVMYI